MSLGQHPTFAALAAPATCWWKSNRIDCWCPERTGEMGLSILLPPVTPSQIASIKPKDVLQWIRFPKALSPVWLQKSCTTWPWKVSYLCARSNTCYFRSCAMQCSSLAVNLQKLMTIFAILATTPGRLKSLPVQRMTGYISKKWLSLSDTVGCEVSRGARAHGSFCAHFKTWYGLLIGMIQEEVTPALKKHALMSDGQLTLKITSFEFETKVFHYMKALACITVIH